MLHQRGASVSMLLETMLAEHNADDDLDVQLLQAQARLKAKRMLDEGKSLSDAVLLEAGLLEKVLKAADLPPCDRLLAETAPEQQAGALEALQQHWHAFVEAEPQRKAKLT